MPSWGDLLGSGSVAEQLLIWGVLNQLLGDLFEPFLQLVTQKVLEANPVIVETPADLADMVVRGIKSQADAAAEALKSGINGQRFDDLVHLTGEPIGLEQGLEAVRRGYMPVADAGLDAPSLERLVRTGRVYNYWLPVIEKLAEVPITPGEAVNAALRGQAPLADMQAEAFASGVNAERFTILLDSAGRPPSPTELLEMVRRGEIPQRGVGPQELSLEQGIHEGDTKNKWFPIYQKLLEYRPPPRITITLYKSGAITAEQAQGYLQDAGLKPELAAAYIKSAAGERMEGTRQLQQGVVLELFQAQAIDQATAAGMLEVLGYTPAQAGFLLELYELRRETTALNKAITRVGTLYTNHRITRQAAEELLGNLKVVGAHRDQLMATWDLEAVSEVKLPTITEIGLALKNGGITADEAMAEALKLGYQPFDAYVAITAHSGGAPGPKPPVGPVGPGVI